MASSKALEEKHAKILHALAQEPGNRKCFDCNQKGPFYVNLTHGTFVCTTCSGIHREFSHRVKSISMATFKPEEVEFMKRNGNEAARRRWLARWTPQDFPEPDSSDQTAIRQFMRRKYQDKVWYREDGAGPGPGPAASGSGARVPDRPYADTGRSPEPRAEPLTNLLGRDLPPIQFGGAQPPPSHGSKPLPKPGGPAAPAPAPTPAPSGGSLVDWDKPKPSIVATSIEDLFSAPTPEQQAQHQAQLQQTQHLQAQFQHAQIMSQFGQANPMMVQQAWYNAQMQQQQQQQQQQMPMQQQPQNPAMYGMAPQMFAGPPTAQPQFNGFPPGASQPPFGGPPLQAQSFGSNGHLSLAVPGGFMQPQTQPQPQAQPQHQPQPPAQPEDIFASLSPLSNLGKPSISPGSSIPRQQPPVQPAPQVDINPFGSDPFGISSPSTAPVQPQKSSPYQSPSMQSPPFQQPQQPIPSQQQSNPFGANPFGSGSVAPPPTYSPQSQPAPFGSYGGGQFPGVGSPAPAQVMSGGPANPFFGSPAGLGQPQAQAQVQSFPGGFSQPAAPQPPSFPGGFSQPPPSQQQPQGFGGGFGMPMAPQQGGFQQPGYGSPAQPQPQPQQQRADFNPFL